jgi:hypothetical protein
LAPVEIGCAGEGGEDDAVQSGYAR